ncbi:MAG TPA: hypothetical protein VFE84_03260, partial [Patescibacteria group bacterium]|nr:hypothetical protein [Patescibacteria group bacterium]
MTRDRRVSSAAGARRFVGVLLLLVVLWLGAGLHRISGGAATLQIKTCLAGGAPRVLSEGWTLAPPMLCRVVVFPATTVAVRGRWGAKEESGGRLIRSREGVGMLAAGTLALQPD